MPEIEPVVWPRTWGGPRGKEASGDYSSFAYPIFYRLTQLGETRSAIEDLCFRFFPRPKPVTWEKETPTFAIFDADELRYRLMMKGFK